MVAIICTTMLHNSDLSSGFLQIKSEIYFGYAIILSILDYFTVYPINSEAGIQCDQIWRFIGLWTTF